MHRYDQRVDRRAIDRAANGEAAVPGKQTLVEASGLYANAGAAVDAASNQSGEALPGHLQRKFEASLGADLSGVRIHRSAQSATAAEAVSAKAYTLGNDIHFGAGHYDPSSPQGEHLLAHEVAHTVQQHGGLRRLQLKGISVSQPGDSHEVEADSAADAMVAGKSATVSGAAAGIAREAAAKPVGAGTGPKLVMSGVPALKAAFVHLHASEGPITVNGGAMGDVTLTPGASIGDMTLLKVGPLQCTYMKGLSIYEAYTPDFVRDIWLTSLVNGVATAEWLVPLAKAELEFAVALLAPMKVVVITSLIKYGAFYLAHKKEIHFAISHSGDVAKLFWRFQTICPTTAKNLELWGLKEMLVNFPKGVELDDVAYFIGRVLGVEGLMGKVESGVAVTLKVLMWVIGEMAFLVTALHSPKIVATGLEEAFKEKAADLKAEMAKGGVTVALDEAARILHELHAHPDGQAMLHEMKDSLTLVGPALAKLALAWKSEMG